MGLMQITVLIGSRVGALSLRITDMRDSIKGP